MDKVDGYRWRNRSTSIVAWRNHARANEHTQFGGPVVLDGWREGLVGPGGAGSAHLAAIAAFGAAGSGGLDLHADEVAAVVDGDVVAGGISQGLTRVSPSCAALAMNWSSANSPRRLEYFGRIRGLLTEDMARNKTRGPEAAFLSSWMIYSRYINVK